MCTLLSMQSWFTTPLVYLSSRPSSYENDYGYKFEVPKYPPPIYWYPNPLECKDVCGSRVCDAYYRRLNDYRMCQQCQSLKTPMCWNSDKQQCVGCRGEKALASCEDRFGAQGNGWLQTNVGPVNPKYTGCVNVGLR